MKALKSAIYSVLAGDSTLTTAATGGIHIGNAPQGTTAPYVVIRDQDPDRATKTGGGATAFKTHMMLVKGVVKTAGDDSEPEVGEDIAARIEALLDNATLTISGATNLASYSNHGVAFEEPASDGKYWHRGFVFKIWTL
jgi:hypothetical protein